MIKNILILGTLFGGSLIAGPVTITINVAGGNFDRGVTTSGLDTGSGFLTSSAGCVGAGCSAISSSIAALNSDSFGFTVTSGSSNGSVSTTNGTLVGSSNLSGFLFTGQNAFNANSSFIENISATGVLGQLSSLTGTLNLTWSGNSGAQARSASGTITLTGNIATAPEPSTGLTLSLAALGFLAMRFRSKLAA